MVHIFTPLLAIPKLLQLSAQTEFVVDRFGHLTLLILLDFSLLYQTKILTPSDFRHTITVQQELEVCPPGLGSPSLSRLRAIACE